MRMKDEIYKIAEKQLLGGGYDKLNFTAISETLNTSRANIHYHFKTKEALAIEVMEQYAARECGNLNQVKEAFKGDFFGFFAAMDNAFWPEDHEGYTSSEASKDGSNNFCSNFLANPKLPESLVKLTKKLYQDVEEILAGIIQDAIDNHQIRADVDARQEALRIHVIMMGIMTTGLHVVEHKQLRGLIMDWANSLK